MPTGSKTIGESLIRDPRLATELDRLRSKSSRNGDELAVALGWSSSKMSRVLRGRHGISRPDLTAFLRELDVPTEQGQAVFALAAACQSTAFTIPGGYFAGAESADRVMEWAPVTVPWLLQTPGYTRALLDARQQAHPRPPSEVRDFTDATGLWQARLPDGQVVLRALLAESVLRRLVGSVQVVRAQLRHLIAVGEGTGRDVQVRVLLDDSPAACSGWAPFTYLEYAGLAGVPDRPAVITWDLDQPRQIEDELLVWKHRIAFAAMWDAADLPAEPVSRALTALDG
jgi:Domain of unknown function (DUF5753)/Helix-turn-helix domain